MKIYENDNPEFSYSLNIIEPSDTNHADNVTEADIQNFQNTLILMALFSTELIQSAFYSVFTEIAEDETALSSDDIAEAISTEWDGSSSEDSNALIKEDVSEATSTEWNGSSSTDETALNSADVSEATSTE